MAEQASNNYNNNTEVAQVANVYDASTLRMRAADTQQVRKESDASRTWMKQHYRRLIQEACDGIRKSRSGSTSAKQPLLLLDNGIGAGGVLHYAQQAGVTHVDANELSAARVDECRKHWQQQQKSIRGGGGGGGGMTADIQQADAFAPTTRAHYQQVVRERRRAYDIIVYHNTLHYGVTSAGVLGELVSFWRTILAPDGVVIIVTVDSDNLACRVSQARKQQQQQQQHTNTTGELVLRDNSLFEIRWPHSAQHAVTTGTPYMFTFHGSFHDAPEHVVDKQQLLSLAEQHGFVSRTYYNLGFCCETSAEASCIPMPTEQIDQLFLYVAMVLRLFPS
jgi:SAM-dependent methyltransferase